jgi:hypothetical protein
VTASATTHQHCLTNFETVSPIHNLKPAHLTSKSKKNSNVSAPLPTQTRAMNSTHYLPYLTCDLTQPKRAHHYYIFKQIPRNNTLPRSSPPQESRTILHGHSCHFKLFLKLGKLKYQNHHVDDLRTVERNRWRARSSIHLKIQDKHESSLPKLLWSLLSYYVKSFSTTAYNVQHTWSPHFSIPIPWPRTSYHTSLELYTRAIIFRPHSDNFPYSIRDVYANTRKSCNGI